MDLCSRAKTETNAKKKPKVPVKPLQGGTHAHGKTKGSDGANEKDEQQRTE
jgi:hypothetical protein